MGLSDPVRYNVVSELWATISQLRAKYHILWQREGIVFIGFYISDLTATRQQESGSRQAVSVRPERKERRVASCAPALMR